MHLFILLSFHKYTLDGFKQEKSLWNMESWSHERTREDVGCFPHVTDEETSPEGVVGLFSGLLTPGPVSLLWVLIPRGLL